MPDCQAALTALRNAEDAYNAAFTAQAAAKAAADRADLALKKAQQAFDAASAAAQKALNDWKTFLDAISQDPTLGVAGMQGNCGFVQDPSKAPDHSTIVGPFHLPDQTRRYLWGRTDQATVQSAWNAKADQANVNAQALEAAAKSTAADLAVAQTTLNNAQQDVTTTHAALDAATAQLKTASQTYDAALANARAACRGVGGQPPEGVNGADLTVDPLVPKKNRNAAKAAIDIPPKKDIKGMKIVQHYDAPKGAPSDALSYYDPADNTVHLINCASKKEIVKHEIGHWVYHNRVLPDDAGAKPDDTWKAFWKAHKSDMPTGIAKEDDDQGFAEAYEFFRDGKKLNPAIEAEIKRRLAKIT